jgi:lysozyme family protein
MQHPFSALAAEYAALLAAMRLDPSREHELAARASAVLELGEHHHDEWAEVTGRTGVPRLWGLASFERESGSDYSRSPAQGDRWDHVSVNVPRGLGPYRSWGEACVAAYRLDRLDEVAGSAGVPPAAARTAAIPGWTWPRACYEGELFNGFGPRAHGRHTGYLWSWTNIYDGGKFVADGVWDPARRDEQCGMVPMMAALLQLDASLALADALPAHILSLPAIPGTSPGREAEEVPAPAVPVVFVSHVTTWLQMTLNRLGATEDFSKYPPLAVDGSYGRVTRRAVAAFQAAHGLTPDGIAGPLTTAAIRRLTTTA